MAEDIRKMESTIGKKSFEVGYEKPDCVVLDSAYCSMGRMVGYKACEIAGYRYYDAVTLLESMPEGGYTKDDLDRIENKYRTREYSREEMKSDQELVDIMKVFEEAVKKAVAEGSCLIHDRTVKSFIESLGYSCLSVFTTVVNEDYQVERALTSPLYKDLNDRDEVLKKIEEENMIRRNIQHYLGDQVFGDVKTYDLVINTDLLGRDYSAQLLAHAMKAD